MYTTNIIWMHKPDKDGPSPDTALVFWCSSPSCMLPRWRKVLWSSDALATFPPRRGSTQVGPWHSWYLPCHRTPWPHYGSSLAEVGWGPLCSHLLGRTLKPCSQQRPLGATGPITWHQKSPCQSLGCTHSLPRMVCQWPMSTNSVRHTSVSSSPRAPQD